MDSLGSKLRSARESKGYDYSHVGRETNIAIRYIEALENEDFSQFPGEPYILGFLRNYGDYLGLDVNELIGLYRTLRIQEEPIPVEQLLKSPKKFPKALLIILICLVALVGIAGGVWYLLSIQPAAETEKIVRQPVQYKLDAESLERRFYVNDSVLVPFHNENFVISLVGISDTVNINSPVGTFPLELSEVKDLDLNGDGIPELSITVADLIKNDASQGSLIRFALIEPEMDPLLLDGMFDPANPAMQNGEVTASAASNSPVLVSSPTAYPFTLQANFEGFCMFRWESDSRPREERYFRRDEVQNIQAQNGIRLWTSNANAVQLQLIAGGRTIDVNLGGPGEVVASDIKWIRGNDGRFTLNLVRLD
ncbi:MAG: helix-turn-helix domain-containing protein [Treponema sp.]|nr:helix-turn-helix domain-containing protein [Treponema sp.]